VGQGPAGSVTGARIETYATDGVIGMDWTPADPTQTPFGFAIGLVAFRVQDANNYMVAGFGLEGLPVAVGAYVNGGLYLLRSADRPPFMVGLSTRHRDVTFAGSRIIVSIDGAVAIDMVTAAFADATGHGLMWHPARDWVSTVDNLAIRGVPRCVLSISSST